MSLLIDNIIPPSVGPNISNDVFMEQDQQSDEETESDKETESEDETESEEEQDIHEEHEFSDDFQYYDSNKIHPAIDCSKLSVLKMILIYFMRHNLTLVGLEDLLKLVNCIVGENSLFTSKYKFFKLFSKSYKPKNMFFCKHCYSDLEIDQNMYEENARSMECTNCKTINHISSTTDNNYFVTYQLESLLKEVISQNINDLVDNEEHNNDTISDITDGNLYKETKVPNVNRVTLTLNTDGVQVFKSKNKSLWPIQFIINELPIKKRFLKKNLLVTGLWFHSTHPPMDLFLKPIMKELISLKTNGLTVKCKKQQFKFDVSLICATLDAPAKSSVQNIMLHSGYYSCSYCEQRGESIEGYVKYPLQENLNQRNHEDAVKNMLLAQEINDNNSNKKVKSNVLGFKGLSPLIAAPGFDLINGFAIDYLHSICEGVVKHLLSLWFDTTNHAEDFYIKHSIEKVNQNISKIQLPSEISRNPRTLLERHQWKANELRSWLLFYSVGALYGILGAKYLKHYAKLVAAIKIYLQKNITEHDLDSARNNLQSFVREFEGLYGKRNMRYNVHTISHMPECVENLGPLWAYSNFPFESNNGNLTNYVNAPKGVLHQICGKYTLSRVMDTPNFFNTDPVKKFENCVAINKHFTTSDIPVKLLGCFKPVKIINIESFNVYNYIFDGIDFLSYDKFMLNNITFSTSKYCQSKKCNDSIIKLSTHIYGEIINIITQKKEIYVVLKQFNISKEISDIFITCRDYIPMEKSNKLIVVPVNLIEYKCCIISLENIQYLTQFEKFHDD